MDSMEIIAELFRVFYKVHNTPPPPGSYLKFKSFLAVGEMKDGKFLELPRIRKYSCCFSILFPG